MRRKLPVVQVPMNLFADDTSGNKSRKWKPIHGLQCQTAGLLKEQRQKGRNVSLLAASTSASLITLAGEAVKKMGADARLVLKIALNLSNIFCSCF